MKNTMEYKGYIGSVEVSEEDGVFFGKVQRIRSLISYEGESYNDLRGDFHNAIDDYLAMRQEDKPSTQIEYADQRGH